jgi:hypothetical protein
MVGTGIVYPQIEREKQDAALKKICLEMNGQIAYTGPQLDKLTCNYTIPQLPLK